MKDHDEDGKYFDDALPLFKKVYLYKNNKTEIDKEWHKEFNAWPKFPLFEINFVNGDSGGYILKPDRVVFQYPPKEPDDSDGNGQPSFIDKDNLNFSGSAADIKPGDLTRAMVYEILVALEKAIKMIKDYPDMVNIYMTRPEDFLKDVHDKVPKIPMRVALGSNDVVFTCDGTNWSVVLPTEGELTQETPREICGLSCSGLSVYYLSHFQEQQESIT